MPPERRNKKLGLDFILGPDTPVGTAPNQRVGSPRRAAGSSSEKREAASGSERPAPKRPRADSPSGRRRQQKRGAPGAAGSASGSASKPKKEKRLDRLMKMVAERQYFDPKKDKDELSLSIPDQKYKAEIDYKCRQAAEAHSVSNHKGIGVFEYAITRYKGGKFSDLFAGMGREEFEHRSKRCINALARIAYDEVQVKKKTVSRPNR